MLELTSGNVKAAMAEAGAKSSDLWMVPLENIRVIDGFNVRERTTGYEAHIVDIGESILANGYRKDKPLTGYVGKDDDATEVDLIALLAFITGAKESAIAESVSTFRAEHSPAVA